MEDFNRIINYLGIRFIKAKSNKLLQSLTVENFYDIENTLLLVNKGTIQCETEKKEKCLAEAGDILFIPGGRFLSITYGSNDPLVLTNDYFISNRWKYCHPILEPEPHAAYENFSYITFEAKVFDSVNFFSSLDIPPFIIKQNDNIKAIIQQIFNENSFKKMGCDRIVKIDTERLIIEVIRYILDQQLFVEQLSTNISYFKDDRLLKIFKYIKENLSGDLSNKMLAHVANISEDYVGQYFKMQADMNPQDYIECQRMEKAVQYLRSSKKSINDIGRDVGYKDTAYFCRRFKLMFGISAGKMRKRDSIMDF